MRRAATWAAHVARPTPAPTSGQLTYTVGLPGWLVSVTGAYCAVKYAEEKHRAEPDTFVKAWLVKVSDVVLFDATPLIEPAAGWYTHVMAPKRVFSTTVVWIGLPLTVTAPALSSTLTV